MGTWVVVFLRLSPLGFSCNSEPEQTADLRYNRTATTRSPHLLYANGVHYVHSLLSRAHKIHTCVAAATGNLQCKKHAHSSGVIGRDHRNTYVLGVTKSWHAMEDSRQRLMHEIQDGVKPLNHVTDAHDSSQPNIEPGGLSHAHAGVSVDFRNHPYASTLRQLSEYCKKHGSNDSGQTYVQ